MSSQRAISRLAVSLSLLSLLGASCIELQVTHEVGGVFVSEDDGSHWASVSEVLATGGARASLSNVAITDLVADPQDHQTLFALFATSSFAVTHDGGVSWDAVRTLPTRATVTALAQHPRDVCVVYVAAGSGVLKSDNCMRTWTTLYIDPRTEAQALSIALDPRRPDTVYTGLSTGEILRSTDTGQTWAAVGRFPSGVRTILVDPAQTGRVDVATTGSGVFVSADDAKSWAPMNQNIEHFAQTTRVLELVHEPSIPGGRVALTPLGMFRLDLASHAWQALRLIPTAGSAQITAIAVNPKDANELYYVSSGVLYVTTDGGVRWKSLRLPTTHPIAKILIDAVNPKRIYIAAAR